MKGSSRWLGVAPSGQRLRGDAPMPLITTARLRPTGPCNQLLPASRCRGSRPILLSRQGRGTWLPCLPCTPCLHPAHTHTAVLVLPHTDPGSQLALHTRPSPPQPPPLNNASASSVPASTAIAQYGGEGSKGSSRGLQPGGKRQRPGGEQLLERPVGLTYCRW